MSGLFGQRSKGAIPHTSSKGGRGGKCPKPHRASSFRSQVHLRLTKDEYREILRGREMALEIERQKIEQQPDKEVAVAVAKPSEHVDGDTTMAGGV